MHDTGPLISAIIGGIVLAALLGLLANRLKISPLVGYLIAGIICGPATPGYVADSAVISQLAEIGVILLMFAVGLHFSLKDLLSVKNIAIPGAVAQITVATLMGMGLAAALGWSMVTGLVFGLSLSTASTVVLLRALEERDLIESTRGRIAIGWLIVEDLAMVLTLVLLPAVVTTMNSDNANVVDILIEVSKTVGLVILFIIFMIIVGRRVIPWVLAKSASTGSDELFTLTVLGIALGIALAAVQLFGASFALGAFFAGMALTESELSQRAANNILPLKDAFAVLFFVSVGMLFDPEILISNPIATVVTVIIIIFGKSIAAYVLVRLFGHSKRTAFTISASLAQIGEFAYILAALGIALNVFPSEAHSLILAGSIISIVLNPFIFNLVERYLNKTENIVDKIIDPVAIVNQQVPEELTDHAIIVGHGRLGSTIAMQLQERNIPFVVVDTSLALVEKLRNEDMIAVFGNAGKLETLELAHLDRARWLIISTPNGYEAGEICFLAREARPDLEIYVRAFYDDEIEYISERGATQVITGEKEISAHILRLLHLDPAEPVIVPVKPEKEVIDIPEESNLPEGNGSPI
ncbi:Kef family K(+) transporter [Zophobihabitans entericus]|uniref:Kef family K(+) transporter n=1 Tax=Zophobihabitans entericus TaxID=1635327 RepID=A0A6G9I9D4_9GAMM|nr:Kef family K(+) transporter [Zophobihabitans entericus]